MIATSLTGIGALVTTGAGNRAALLVQNTSGRAAIEAVAGPGAPPAPSSETGVHAVSSTSADSVAVLGRSTHGTGVHGSTDDGYGVIGAGYYGVYGTGVAGVVGDVNAGTGVQGWTGVAFAPTPAANVGVWAGAETGPDGPAGPRRRQVLPERQGHLLCRSSQQGRHGARRDDQRQHGVRGPPNVANRRMGESRHAKHQRRHHPDRVEPGRERHHVGGVAGDRLMGRPSLPGPVAALRRRSRAAAQVESDAKRPALPDFVAIWRSEADRRVQADGATAPEPRVPRRDRSR